MKFLKKYGQLIARVLIATIFLLSGYNKLMAPENVMAYMDASGIPLVTLSFWLAVIVELGGGILLIIGKYLREATLVLIVFMILIAYYLHNPLVDQGQLLNFFKNLAIIGGLFSVLQVSLKK